MEKYILAEETLGYQTSDDSSNADYRLLVAGSQNTLIDYQKKVMKRPGYTRLGTANTALTENRNAWTWGTSTAVERAQRFYNDQLEVYLATVDGVAINAWTRVSQGWNTTNKLRYAFWYDATEKIDLQIMCQGDANLYEWNGAVAVISAVGVGTVTKSGTKTFAQSRFYTTRNKTFVCVRTGTEYTYTGGENSTTITGIVDTAGLIAGDIIVQKIVTQSNKPDANHNNDIIFVSENQLTTTSYTDELGYLSKNTSYFDFAFASPRLPGEGALFTFTDPGRAINQLGDKLLYFCGPSTIFKVVRTQLTVGTTITETVKVEKLNVGVNQGALNQESVVSVGDELVYLTNEVALRTISDPANLTGIDPKTLSNPIKPDFDAETWTGAFGTWYKNILIFTAPLTSHMYMLNFVQDADGKLFRFWNPPQILPVGPMSIFDGGSGPLLYGHSNAVPETYQLFDGLSDGQYPNMDVADKFPIHAIAAFAYNSYGSKALLKNFDEYYTDGEITPNTTHLLLDLNYDFEGSTQQIEKTIDGSDETILEGVIGFNSLAQSTNGSNPLGGLLNPPASARNFRIVHEIAKEDMHQDQAIYSTNDVDEYWAIRTHGSNAKVSTRKDNKIRK